MSSITAIATTKRPRRNVRVPETERRIVANSVRSSPKGRVGSTRTAFFSLPLIQVQLLRAWRALPACLAAIFLVAASDEARGRIRALSRKIRMRHSRRLFLRHLGGAALLGSWRPRIAASSIANDRGASATFVVALPDGRRLACRRFGSESGAPAFYFHGMPGSNLEPALIAEEIQQGGLQLIAIDRPGIGGSDMQPDRRVLNWPCDVDCLANYLGWSTFGIIGLSGGAPFALACAAALPHRVTRLALVSGHAPIGPADVEPGNQDGLVKLVAKTPRLVAAVFRRMRAKLESQPDQTMQKLVKSWTDADRRLVFGNPQSRCSFLLNLRRAFCQPRGLAHDIGLLAKCWGFDISPAARCTAIKIWQGCCDGLAPPSHGRYFHRRLPGSELILDPCTSHVTTAKTYAADIVAHVAGEGASAESTVEHRGQNCIRLGGSPCPPRSIPSALRLC